MKKLNLILNIILIIAVGVLFFLFFAKHHHDGKVNTVKTEISKNKQSANGKIVYVNIDTLLNNYELYKEMKAQMQAKSKRSEAEFAARQNTFQKAAADYQNKAQKGLITSTQAQETEQRLMQEQQNLMQLRDRLTQELASEEQKLNKDLIESIQKYLKEFNKDGRYEYILSNSYAGSLLYANDSLNITSMVLKGLNEQYKKKAAK
jgi:outer membrane protein